MPIMLDHFGISVPGQVTRKFDGTDTVLTITLDQAMSIHADLTNLLDYLSAEETTDTTWPTEAPNHVLPPEGEFVPPPERFGGPPPKWLPRPPSFDSNLEAKLDTATQEAHANTDDLKKAFAQAHEPPFPHTMTHPDPDACNCLDNDSACWHCSKGSHQDCTADQHGPHSRCLRPSVTVTKNTSGKWEASARLGTHRGWALQKTEEEARSKALLRLQSSLEGWFEPIRKE